MKYLKFVFFILFFFSLAGLKAQQNHFIYIQTENKQPFYVKLDKKIFSSSESGYLVVPKLKDGEYRLAIGFPKSEWTEQNMLCTVDNNDAGYLLKNFDSKGWGLFNVQTLAVTMASDTGKINNVEVVNKTDAFSNMLSTVVNDSTIRQTEKLKDEVKRAPLKEEEGQAAIASNERDTSKPAAVIETAGHTTKVSKATDTGIEPAVKETEAHQITRDQPAAATVARSVITRSLLNKNENGTEMIFIDDTKGQKDTVKLFIPAEQSAQLIPEKKEELSKPVPLKIEEKASDTAMISETELSRHRDISAENKEVKNNLNGNADTLQVSAPPGRGRVDGTVQKGAMINSDCKNLASDEDFLKLRKKMAAEGNDDDMVILAKKIFKTKCFTVEQVKNLSVLFLKDAGKYAFFDMAYPFVSDSHNFNTLQNQLSESYYINRFQVMIRH